MKKLSLAFTLLSSLALTGTAFADHDRGRAPVVDHRNADVTVVDRRTDAPIIVTDAAPLAGGLTIIEHASLDGRQTFRQGRPVAAPPAMPGAAMMQARLAPAGWKLLAVQSTPYRRGAFTISLPARGDLDHLRLMASERGLDIVAVKLQYARGRTEIVRPARDGSVAIDLAKNKLQSIQVTYVNRGAGRDAAIRVLGKDEPKVGWQLGHRPRGR